MTKNERVAIQYLADGKSVGFTSMMTGIERDQVYNILKNNSHKALKATVPEKTDQDFNDYLQQRNDKIINALRNGTAPASLAFQYGLTTETVAMIGWRAGIAGIRRTKSIQLAAVTPQWPCGLPKAEWPRCGHIHNCYLSNKCGACK